MLHLSMTRLAVCICKKYWRSFCSIQFFLKRVNSTPEFFVVFLKMSGNLVGFNRAALLGKFYTKIVLEMTPALFGPQGSSIAAWLPRCSRGVWYAAH